MGKTFALILVAIALVSTGIFISHHWWFPEVASSHGEAMNHQFTETFVGAGIGFVLAQIGLAAFVWQFGEKKGQEKSSHLSGRREGLDHSGVYLCGLRNSAA